MKRKSERLRRPGPGRRRFAVPTGLALLLCLNLLVLPVTAAFADADGVTKTLVCTLEESVGHQHTPDCCQLVRGALRCTETDAGHVHTDDCYDWEAVLVCGMEEGEGAHLHDESCYRIDTPRITGGPNEGEPFDIPDSVGTGTTTENRSSAPDISAGLEGIGARSYTGPVQYQASSGGLEVPAVITLPSGYRLPEGYVSLTTSWPVALPEQEQPEVPHGPTSVLPEQMILEFAEHSDPTADVEDEDDWNAMFAGMHLSGNWAADLIAVAESQLGYCESTSNYAIAYDRSIKGYTRYGAWYGIPYGDWCAMFISFCMHYAEIPWSAIPYSCHCVVWVNELDALGLYHRADEYDPKPGDLIFFDYDVDGRSDHAGIVVGLNYPAGTIYTIEGNRFDYVEEFELIRNDYTIMGYGELPENPREGLGHIGGGTLTTLSGSGSQSASQAASSGANAVTVGSYYPSVTVPERLYPTNDRTRLLGAGTAAEAAQPEVLAEKPQESELLPCLLERIIRMKTTEIVPEIERGVIQTMST